MKKLPPHSSCSTLALGSLGSFLRGVTGVAGFELERFLVFFAGDVDNVAFFHVAAEQVLGERVLEVLLDGAPHGSGSVVGIVAFLHKELLGGLGEFERDLLGGEALEHDGDFEVDDLDEIISFQHVEDDLLVETIEELRFKDLLGALEDLFLHAFVVGMIFTHGRKAEGVLLLDQLSADI